MREGAGQSPSPPNAVPPPSRYRRLWLPELAVLGMLAALTALISLKTELDRTAAAWFFDPLNPDDPFPARALPPWNWLHRGVAFPVIAAAGGAIAALGASLRSTRWALRRRHAVAVLLAFALGPGLLVNMILKDHWGRPRPTQVREFGGREEYRSALQPGRRAPGRGKSFPCGHSSAGYAFSIFYLLFRRQRPRLAALCLLFAFVYGTALGVGRMAAGAHFATDVISSAVLVHLVNVGVYFFALNVPGHEDAMAAGREVPTVSLRTLSVWAALGIAVFVGALLATPHRWDFDVRYPLSEGAPETVRIRVAADDIRVCVHSQPEVRIEGHYEGFGAFNAAIRHRESRATEADGFSVSFAVTPRGWFTELDGQVKVHVPATGVNALELTAETRGAAVEANGPPPLYRVRIQVPAGSVRLPPAWGPQDPPPAEKETAPESVRP